MLHNFLTSNRVELVGRCRAKAEQRKAPKSEDKGLADHGIATFLEQLIQTLRLEQKGHPTEGYRVSGPPGGGDLALSDVGEASAHHGHELLMKGLTVDQVVHDYGDLCQSITDLAFETNFPIDVDEFRTLNRCLDNGIAEAVTEFSYQRDFLVAEDQENILNVRLGEFAHEARNLLSNAVLAASALKAGKVGSDGATASVLDRSLSGLRSLIDRSITDVRVSAGLPVYQRMFSLAEFISEVRLSSEFAVASRQCSLIVNDVDPSLAVKVDRDLLLSAVSNLLQNAFKFTRERSEVTLNAYSAADRILIEIGDQCGGLASVDPDTLFLPFVQTGKDKSGIGLGLSISKKSVEANGGSLSVRDVPGTGCVFTIDLPRRALH